MVSEDQKKVDVIAALIPHAGYMCSGQVAGEVYSRIKSKDTFIILGPNHTGNGARFACSEDNWETPLGIVDTDKEVISLMKRKTNLFSIDTAAHMYEHSIEVQVPFIQRISDKAKIVPVCLQYGSIEELNEIARALSDTVKEINSNAIIIASSDMTHYESRKIAKEKDKKAIDKILALDPEGLMHIVEEENISMCGCIPAFVMLASAKALGAKNSTLVKYTDSGETTGDIDDVVGYAGMIIN